MFGLFPVFSRQYYSKGRAIGMVVICPSARLPVTDVLWLTGWGVGERFFYMGVKLGRAKF